MLDISIFKANTQIKGTYLVSRTIELYFGTQLIGDVSFAYHELDALADIQRLKTPQPSKLPPVSMITGFYPPANT